MKTPKRKNKPGAGRPVSGRDFWIKCRVVRNVGEQMAAQAQSEGWAPMLERIWRERADAAHKR